MITQELFQIKEKTKVSLFSKFFTNSFVFHRFCGSELKPYEYAFKEIIPKYIYLMLSGQRLYLLENSFQYIHDKFKVYAKSSGSPQILVNSSWRKK